jgi:hypothetical protein
MQKLSDSRANLIFRDILRLVKRKPPSFFQIRKMRGYSGWCIWDDTPGEDFIELDYRDKLMSTAIHECVHYLFPEWCETQVEYAERRIINTVDTFVLSKFMKEVTLKIYQREFGIKKAFAAKRRKRKL